MSSKKLFILILIVFFGVFSALAVFEIVLHAIPLIYKTIPESKKTKYIYILGESSAYGIPYNGKVSFVQIIQYISSNKIDNRNIEVINLARPGCRLIHQYFNYYLYRYTHPFRRGIVLIYAGTNDISYEYPDLKYPLMYNLNLTKLADLYINGTLNFQYVYESIIRLSKKFGDDIYISTIAGNYSGFMPDNVHLFNRNKGLISILNKIDKLFFDKKYYEALNLCKKNVYISGNQYIFYRIGKIYEKLGNVEKANKFYIKAIDVQYSDQLRYRPTTYQNRIIKFLAVKYNVGCLYLFSKIYNSGEVIGYNFFIDKIHPTLRLNWIIAKGFMNLLAKKYEIKETDNIFAADDVKKIFGLKKWDIFCSYIQALGEIYICAYRYDVFDVYSYQHIKNYTKIIKSMEFMDTEKTQEKENTIQFMELLLEYISANNGDKSKEKINKMYGYGLKKKYVYARDINFRMMLEENNII